ncbi:SAM-dependent methyltransferase [Micromonospora sp. BRA006-A]|nr:SAM-dependent methyltransferase [Micromonospora sp. BRA006-A]
MAARFPTIRISALENRRFLRRAVRHLAGEAGIRQFLDIGTGIPTADNTHEVAQATDPRARVVYVDNDPIVLAHARALLTSSPRAPPPTSTRTCATRSASSPTPTCAARWTSPSGGVDAAAVLHFVPDGENPYAIVGRLLEALPAGSYLAASHATHDYLPAEVAAEAKAAARGGGPHGVINGPAQPGGGRALLRRLELVEPGICSVAEWHADGGPNRARR